jgi:hypothetical protein
MNATAITATRTEVFAVLSLREIRNLLLIAEREADLHPDVRERDLNVVVLRGDANLTKDGRASVALLSAGYSEPDVSLWSRQPVTV